MALCVRYFIDRKTYELGYAGDYGYSCVKVYSTGYFVTNIVNDMHRDIYIRAFYCLGILTLKAQVMLGVELSATEKIEWETAFDERLERMTKD